MNPNKAETISDHSISIATLIFDIKSIFDSVITAMRSDSQQLNLNEINYLNLIR